MRLVRAAIHKNRSKGKGRRSKSKDAKSDPPPPPPGLGGDLDELLLAGSATPVRTLPFAANSPPYIALHRLSRPFLCLSQPFHRLSPPFTAVRPQGPGPALAFLDAGTPDTANGHMAEGVPPAPAAAVGSTASRNFDESG